MAERHAAPAPAAAPEPSKKEKERPPSPPRFIRDREGRAAFERIRFLGEGGFARVYEVVDRDGIRKAVKVVSKSSIRTKKNKTKLWAEIKLHQMLAHPHIVRFEDCFEDADNVYMVLELCENGSLMDLLRRRKRYTEAEARLILVQLIAACQYMHQTNVIHRDLKLGNLFLDAEMNVKVGDFGLAALIEKPGDRKKTICGTPNYIAPEVLFDTANGHSFEVDVWSVGVILYTLLIGKPPFQTKDVKAIYKRIRENRYEFPVDKVISSSAQDLIMSILNTDPEQRPALDTILSHPWFHSGSFPSHIPLTANDHAPEFRHLSPTASRRNFEAVCRTAKIGATLPINTAGAKMRLPLGPSILQQEKDFKNAVQPDSPISALLKSAKQPLVQAPAEIKEPALLRKLSAAGAQSTLSPVRRTANKENAHAGPSSANRKPIMERVDEDEEGEEDEDEGQVQDQQRDADPRTYMGAVREQEVARQKARIVSQMARKEATANEERAERASPRRAALAPATTLPASRETRVHDVVVPAKVKDGRASLFEIFAKTLEDAIATVEAGGVFEARHVPSRPPAPKVFVVSWLDYCTKYGMGFAMSDGTIAVHFNDTSSLVLSPGKLYFDHIAPAGTGDLVQGVRKNYSIEGYPRDLSNKVYLLRHFESYMLDRLFGDQPYTYEDKALTKGMVFVTRYLRMKHVIVFRLSNDVLQFNFYDHVKLILSQGGLIVSVIDKHHMLRTWSLEELLQPVDEGIPSKERRRMEGVMHKVQYAKDVLVKIRAHQLQSKPKATATASGPNAPTAREAVRPIR